jgi:1-deoxy-D-xylulose-5-phosphate synthase
VRNGTRDVLIVSHGAMAATAVDVADRLVAQGIGVTVVDPRWVKPVDPELVQLAVQYDLVVTLEDNGRHGGVGAAITQAVRDAGIATPIQVHGVEQEFLDHAKREVILERLGLTPRAIADDTLAALSRNSAKP